jgi:hypothetical protein
LEDEQIINEKYKQLQQVKENLAALDGRNTLLKDKENQFINLKTDFDSHNL